MKDGLSSPLQATSAAENILEVSSRTSRSRRSPLTGRFFHHAITPRMVAAFTTILPARALCLRSSSSDVSGRTINCPVSVQLFLAVYPVFKVVGDARNSVSLDRAKGPRRLMVITVWFVLIILLAVVVIHTATWWWRRDHRGARGPTSGNRSRKGIR